MARGGWRVTRGWLKKGRAGGGSLAAMAPGVLIEELQRNLDVADAGKLASKEDPRRMPISLGPGSVCCSRLPMPDST